MEWLIIIAVVGFIIWRVMKKKVKLAQFEALPQDGPMQVNIKEEPIPAGTFGSKQFTCALLITVVISQRDWQAIANAGLMEHVLFEFPSVAGDGEMWTFEVKRLQGPGEHTVRFNNILQMQEAKEKFIEALHSLRSQIDRQRSGPQTERMEI